MTDGLIILNCDYCESLVGYLDTKPTYDNLVIKGAQACCISCFNKRQAPPPPAKPGRKQLDGGGES